jgi:plasmid rolling circle replication initiator protein Rep
MDNYTLKQEKNQAHIIGKYTVKRVKNNQFGKYIKPFISEKSLNLINDCGSFLMFLADKNLENRKLHSGNFCKNRFCPMCSWRLARKDSLSISILIQYITQEKNKDFIFVTLTTPNVTNDLLQNEIKHLNNSFKKLMKRKEILLISKGYIRKLEITYSKDEFITKELYEKKRQYFDIRNLKIGDRNPVYNTYNPHFHCVIAVNKSYFSDKDYYIKREKWLELWRESTKDFSITQVDVRKANLDNPKQVYELAKYSAKDSDYLISDSVFKTFYIALKGKQLLVYGGLFKEALKLFKEGKLDKYKEKDKVKYFYMIMYKWQLKEYEEFKNRPLTDDELKRFNDNYVDEISIDD